MMPLRIASRRKMSTSASSLKAQIRAADDVALFELGGRARERDAADLQQIGAVDELEHLLNVLLDDEHRVTFLRDGAHEVEDLLHHQRRQTRRGLVEQQEAGL